MFSGFTEPPYKTYIFWFSNLLIITFDLFLEITDSEEYEYVRGYYDLESGSECGASKGSSGFYDVGFVKLKLTCTNDREAKNGNCTTAIDGVETEANPISKAAWQFTRLNLPKKVNGDIDVGEETEESAFLSTLKQMANMFEGIVAFFNDGYNNQMRNKGYGKVIIKGKSWIRLYNPDHKKLAGTHRVKKITINDNWASMAGGNHQSSEYGQEYSYDMIDPISGQTISAGVAAYEPLIGGEEIPYRKPIKYSSPFFIFKFSPQLVKEMRIIRVKICFISVRFFYFCGFFCTIC